MYRVLSLILIVGAVRLVVSSDTTPESKTAVVSPDSQSKSKQAIVSPDSRSESKPEESVKPGEGTQPKEHVEQQEPIELRKCFKLLLPYIKLIHSNKKKNLNGTEKNLSSDIILLKAGLL